MKLNEKKTLIDRRSALKLLGISSAVFFTGNPAEFNSLAEEKKVENPRKLIILRVGVRYLSQPGQIASV